jgi:hypothetical protein
MAAERRLSAELLHEHEPAAVGGPCGPGVVALVEGFEGSWPGAVKLSELLVVALEGFLSVRGDFDEASEDVDRLELVDDKAAGRDLDRPFPRALQQVEDLVASGRRLKRVWGLSRNVRWLPT